MPTLNIEELSISQRLELIGQLWDSIPDTVEALPVPDDHRAELDRRLRAAEEAPESGTPWEGVRSRLRKPS